VRVQGDDDSQKRRREGGLYASSPSPATIPRRDKGYASSGGEIVRAARNQRSTREGQGSGGNAASARWRAIFRGRNRVGQVGKDPPSKNAPTVENRRVCWLLFVFLLLGGFLVCVVFVLWATNNTPHPPHTPPPPPPRTPQPPPPHNPPPPLGVVCCLFFEQFGRGRREVSRLAWQRRGAGVHESRDSHRRGGCAFRAAGRRAPGEKKGVAGAAGLRAEVRSRCAKDRTRERGRLRRGTKATRISRLRNSAAGGRAGA